MVNSLSVKAIIKKMEGKTYYCMYPNCGKSFCNTQTSSRHRKKEHPGWVDPYRYMKNVVPKDLVNGISVRDYFCDACIKAY